MLGGEGAASAAHVILTQVRISGGWAHSSKNPDVRQDDEVSGGRSAPYAAVPPTVSPSISRVGWPTPAGIDWPPLPQMPTPSSSAMSLPIPATLVSTVGPSPIRVAPLIGAPSLPFSIR